MFKYGDFTLFVLVMWRLWHIFSPKKPKVVFLLIFPRQVAKVRHRRNTDATPNGFHGALDNTPEPVSYRSGEDDEQTGEDADGSSLVHTLRWHVAVLSSSLRPRRVSSIWRFEVTSAFEEDLWKSDPFDRPYFLFLRRSSPRGFRVSAFPSNKVRICPSRRSSSL